MKESRKHVCGIERLSKLVYIYHALLVLKGGRSREEAIGAIGETKKGAVMEALDRFCCLLFFIFINISG
jgi:hypothetical protein